MGASVGIGGLIIGISMLVVFSMAYASISTQIDSGLDRLDDASDPVPTFSIDDATLWEGAVVDLTIAQAGADYNNGTLSASGGFEGTYTVDVTGAIISVVITSHGNYSSSPLITITCGTTCSSAAGGNVTATLGNVIHANFTNTGVVTVDHESMWVFTDGSNPITFDTIYTSSISSSKWYTGETVYLNWVDATSIGESRISLTAGSTTVAHQLA